MRASRCERKGHNFEGRYSYGEPVYDIETAQGTTAQLDAMTRMLKATRSQTYVCDICTRCGERIER